jgi:hypothetical protein
MIDASRQSLSGPEPNQTTLYGTWELSRWKVRGRSSSTCKITRLRHCEENPKPSNGFDLVVAETSLKPMYDGELLFIDFVHLSMISGLVFCVR